MVQGHDVFTWGKSSSGRLGTGTLMMDSAYCPVARVEHLDLLKIQVLSVVCGYGLLPLLAMLRPYVTTEHTIAKCSQGVYAWGDSKHGQVD